jgi:hypothetical protein
MTPVNNIKSFNRPKQYPVLGPMQDQIRETIPLKNPFNRCETEPSHSEMGEC